MFHNLGLLLGLHRCRLVKFLLGLSQLWYVLVVHLACPCPNGSHIIILVLILLLSGHASQHFSSDFVLIDLLHNAFGEILSILLREEYFVEPSWIP